MVLELFFCIKAVFSHILLAVSLIGVYFNLSSGKFWNEKFKAQRVRESVFSFDFFWRKHIARCLICVPSILIYTGCFCIRRCWNFNVASFNWHQPHVGTGLLPVRIVLLLDIIDLLQQIGTPNGCINERTHWKPWAEPHCGFFAHVALMGQGRITKAGFLPICKFCKLL